MLCLFGVLVVLAGITLSTANGRNVWRVDVLARQSVPSNLSKPGVVLDIIRATVQVTEALGQVGCDQLRQEINGVVVQVWRVLDLAAQDIFIDLDWGSAIPEGRESAKHFED